jgi:hypothetical protein
MKEVKGIVQSLKKGESTYVRAKLWYEYVEINGV